MATLVLFRAVSVPVVPNLGQLQSMRDQHRRQINGFRRRRSLTRSHWAEPLTAVGV